MIYEAQLDKARLIAQSMGISREEGAVLWVNIQRILGREPKPEMYLSVRVIAWAKYFYSLCYFLPVFTLFLGAEPTAALTSLVIFTMVLSYDLHRVRGSTALPKWEDISSFHSTSFETWKKSKLSEIQSEQHAPTRRALQQMFLLGCREGWIFEKARQGLGRLGMRLRPRPFYPLWVSFFCHLLFLLGLVGILAWGLEIELTPWLFGGWAFLNAVLWSYIQEGPEYKRLPSWRSLEAVANDDD